MKKFLLISIIFPFCCMAQSNDYFAPIGAEWYYTWSYPSNSGYIKISSTKDSIIESRLCKILEEKLYTYNDSTVLGNEYVYEDSGRVFYYRYNKFYKLYDFNAKPGDGWEIAGDFSFGSEGPNDSVGYIQVDSVGKLFINNDSLRYMYVSSPITSKWFFGISADVCYWPSIMIIEKISCLSYMFPRPVCLPSDYSNTGQLRCYFDSLFGNFSTNIVSDCSYIFTGIEKVNEVPYEINVFPTITNENITMSITHSKNHSFFSVSVYDLYGRVQINTILNTFETHIFSLKNLDNGFFIVKIKTKYLYKSFLILKIN